MSSHVTLTCQQSCLPSVIFLSQCSKRFHLHVSSEKEHESMIPSMANGQWFFHLSQQQWRFCHENYLVLACMHTTVSPTATFKISFYMVSTYAESLLRNCFGHLHVYNFSKTKKFMLGSKFSWSRPSAKTGSLNLAHEIHVYISPMKIFPSTVYTCSWSHIIDRKHFDDFYEGITYQITEFYHFTQNQLYTLVISIFHILKNAHACKNGEMPLL